MPDLRARLDAALGDRYEVGQRVGEGGMSFVFAATDRKHGRDVAVKILRPEVAASVGSDRFLREIEIAARCTHPHILPLYDSGAADGLVYFVMPLAEGPTLRDRMSEGPVPLEEAVRISGQMSAALAYAHDKELIHRDVKPGNVLMLSGQAVVTDFGVARALTRAGEGGGELLTGTGMVLGTLSYMSPEQAEGGGEVDGRTDQYALACMLWEMLTGERLFKGLTPPQILARKLTAETPLPAPTSPEDGVAIPASVRGVLERATASKPDDRFATLYEYQAALERAATRTEIERVEAARARGARVRGGAVALAVAALAAGAWWAVGALGGPDYERIAILPLQNAGPEEDAFFVEGMHESLIAELQQAGVSVIGRRSVLQFADDAAASVGQIAEQLGTDAIVEGEAYRRADSVGITVRLLDGATDVQMWQQTFSAQASGILTLYGEITAALAGEMGLELTESVRARLARDTPVNPQAYEAYVRGQFHWNRLTPNDLVLAEENFREALRIDPRYAPAHAGLAAVAAGRQQMGLLAPEVAVPVWEENVRAAIDLDSTDAVAWGNLAGLQAWAYWDWDSARASSERALELNSSDAMTEAYYAHILMITGDTGRALEQADRALIDDPLNPLVAALACVVHGAIGELGRAAEICDEALAQDPGNPVANGGIQNVLFRERDWDGLARSNIALATALGAGELAAVIEGALPEGGQVALRRGAEFLESASEETFILPTHIVNLYAGSDTPERALPWLAVAVGMRDPGATYLGVTPNPPAIRASPEMEALTEAVGIPNQYSGAER